MHKIIRLPEVMDTTGLARSTIYKMITAGTFPKQFLISKKSVGWLNAEVQSWVHQRHVKSSLVRK